MQRKEISVGLQLSVLFTVDCSAVGKANVVV